MTRLATLARGTLAASPDGQLLDRFLADRDEVAFAELVRRYAPVVWGTCRRTLPHPADAEDAFQAAFLVLVRRATRAAAHPALGPWLHRVAFLTARNLARANRRRAAVAGRLPRDVPAPDPTDRADARLDLDAALSSLSDRHRAAVVLCHLQGLSRKEAADRLGCAEGTLSATLAAALKKLRARLAGRDPLVVLAAAATAAPAGLSAATARTAMIYTTSALRTAGVSPAVAGLIEGVLHMFWVKKVAAACTVVALAAGGLVAGLTVRPGGAAQATAPPAAPPAPAEDPEARLKKELADLWERKAEIKKREEAAQAELDRLAAAKKERDAVVEVGADLVVAINHVEEYTEKPPYTVRQVVGGKVRDVHCSDSEALALFLGRTFRDPTSPKVLRVSAFELNAYREQVRRVFAVCAAAGYRKVTFASTAPGIRHVRPYDHAALVLAAGLQSDRDTPPKTTTTEVDLAAVDKVDLSKYHPKP